MELVEDAEHVETAVRPLAYIVTDKGEPEFHASGKMSGRQVGVNAGVAGFRARRYPPGAEEPGVFLEVKGPRTMRHRRDVSAGVIVFHRRDGICRFLLLRSSQTKRPLWEFPKGAVDEGETLFAAALRELQEETGLREQDIRIVPGFERRETYRFTAGDGGSRTAIRKQVTYYLAETQRTDVTLSPVEATRFAWVRLEEALRKVRYKARRTFLAAAAEAAECVATDGEASDAVPGG
jgi:8-oxo-dGTP pyrophosphatase MutT (NUDIX family)